MIITLIGLKKLDAQQAHVNLDWALQRHVALYQELEKRNVKHEYYIGSEGAHDFITWRHLMYYRFLPQLFRKQ